MRSKAARTFCRFGGINILQIYCGNTADAHARGAVRLCEEEIAWLTDMLNSPSRVATSWIWVKRIRSGIIPRLDAGNDSKTDRSSQTVAFPVPMTIATKRLFRQLPAGRLVHHVLSLPVRPVLVGLPVEAHPRFAQNSFARSTSETGMTLG
jgi:hypothetical protein